MKSENKYLSANFALAILLIFLSIIAFLVLLFYIILFNLYTSAEVADHFQKCSMKYGKPVESCCQEIKSNFFYKNRVALDKDFEKNSLAKLCNT